MKREKLDFAHAVSLARCHWDVPLRVALRPYVRFSRHLDAELGKLVAQWAHAAAPNATMPRRRRI